MRGLEERRSHRKRSRAATAFTVLTEVVIAIVFSCVVVLPQPARLSVARASETRIDRFAAGQQGRDEIRIEINGNGFTPGEVQHAPGSFAILVENTTLSSEYTLRLKAEDGTVLNEVQIQKGSSAWSVSLQTGRYTLTEINHSQWTCVIVVQ